MIWKGIWEKCLYYSCWEMLPFGRFIFNTIFWNYNYSWCSFFKIKRISLYLLQSWQGNVTPSACSSGAFWSIIRQNNSLYWQYLFETSLSSILVLWHMHMFIYHVIMHHLLSFIQLFLLSKIPEYRYIKKKGCITLFNGEWPRNPISH